MKKVFLLISCIVLFAANAMATTYTGAMDNRFGYTPIAGFTGEGNSWSGSKSGKGLRIEWTVDDTSTPGYWTYTYTLVRASAMNKAFALFDIETGSNFTSSNIQSWQVVYAKNSSGGAVSGIDFLSTNSANFNVSHTFILTPDATYDNLSNTEYNQYSGDPANPVAHSNFYGLRWKFPGTGHNSFLAVEWQLKLVSNRAPMWGKFFGWGDQTTLTPYTYASFYSNNIDSSSRPSGYGNYDPAGASSGWVLVPGN